MEPSRFHVFSMLLLMLLLGVSQQTFAGKSVNGNTTTWTFPNTNANQAWYNGWSYNFGNDFASSTDGELTDLLLKGYITCRRGSVTLTANNNANHTVDAGIKIPAPYGATVKVTGYCYAARTPQWNGVTELSGNGTFSNSWAEVTATCTSIDGYISIVNNNDRDIQISKIEVIENTDLPIISFTQTGPFTYNLVNLGFEEPALVHSLYGHTLIINPNAAAGSRVKLDGNYINESDQTYVRFSSSNEKIAKIGNAATGDLMFINTGWVTITATVTDANYSSYTASYNVLVMANDAQWVVEGNRCYFPTTNPNTGTQNIGKLLDRTVKSVPFMEMQFGDASNTNCTLVKEEDGMLTATVIDENGWRQLWWRGSNGEDNSGSPIIPYQGSFYIFKPEVNGNLKVKGVLSGNTAQLVDAYNNYSVVGTILESESGQEKSFSVQGGHTYYLYGNVPSTNGGGWGHYRLSEFTFEHNFKFAARSVTVPHGTTSYAGMLVPGASNVTYTAEAKGDITSFNFNSSTGEITNITGDGGAIVVTCTDNASGAKVSYVLTVAYETHRWDFTTGHMESISAIKQNTDDWAITYKVREYDGTTRALTYLNAPVLVASTNVEGDNALWLDETAGLVITSTTGKSFGTTVSVPDAEGVTSDDPEVKDAALKTMLNYGPEMATGEALFMDVEAGTVVTIPNLKAGQYVMIRADRHGAGQGDLVTVTNVTDLEGTDMDGKQFYAGSGPMHRQGNHEFIVKEDGSVTFTVSDTNWLDFYYIEVGNEFIDTDLRFVQSPTTYAFRTGGSAGASFSTSYGTMHQTSSNTLEYSIKAGSCTGTITTSNTTVTDAGDGTYTFSSTGHGTFVLVQKGKNQSNNYVLDMQETLIKVFEYDYPTATYPHSWDFENISTVTGNTTAADMAADAALTTDKYWTAGSSGNYSLIADNPNNMYGSLVTNNGTSSKVIAEAEGLGLLQNTFTDASNSQIVFSTANDGLQLSGAEHTLVIPAVPLGYTVYIKADVTGSLKRDDSDLSADSNYGDAYVIEGDGSDIELKATNVLFKQIGVTTINDRNAQAAYDNYFTDCQAAELRYELTGMITGNDLTAYYVDATDIGEEGSAYEQGANTINLTPLAVCESGEGTIIKASNTQNGIPLFVRDVNTPVTSHSTMLVGVLTSTTVTATDGDYRNYAFTNLAGKVDESGNPIETFGTVPLGFYRAIASSTLGAHKCYLHLPKSLVDSSNSGSTSAPAYMFINFLDDDTTTAIGQLPMTEGSTERNDSYYYTLDGVRHQGVPTAKGLYIVNGKKVYVK